MSEFDCGNRTDSCDNATICPCMDFINKETRSYSELLQSSLFREATKEEREGVENYIKSISKKLHTFTDEQLEEHDKQMREDGVKEFAEWLPQHFDLRFSNNPEVWLDEYFNHTKEKVLAEVQKGTDHDQR